MANARRILTPWKVGLTYAILSALFAAVLWGAPAVRVYELWDGRELATAWGVIALALIAGGWAAVGLRQRAESVPRMGAGAALTLAAVSLFVAGYLIWQERPLLEGTQQLVEAEAEQIGQAVSADETDE